MSTLLRPADPRRALRATVRATALVVTVLSAYGLAAGEPRSSVTYWMAMMLGLALAGVGWMGGTRSTRDELWWLMYAFLIPGVALMSWFAVAASPGPVDLWLPLWALHAVNTAYSLPRAGQLVAHALGAGSLAVVLVLRDAGPDVVVLDVGLYIVLALLTARLSERLREVVAARRAARIEAEDRHQLLVALARMNHLDVARAAQETVAGLTTLGYEMSTLGLLDEANGMLHPIAALGFDDDAFADEPIPLGRGLAGEAVEQRRTVLVEDYRTFEHRLEGRREIRAGVAAPIIVEGRVRGVLQGARRAPGVPDAASVEVIEVLAAQASRILRNAERFQRERATGERLRELDRLKGDFIASVSHELRTPLTVLQGAGQTLAERSADLTPEQRAMLTERLNANADRLDRMITALLQMSNLESGGVTVAPEVVPLESVISRVTASFDDLRERHLVDLDLEGVEVRADPRLLELVLGSLIGNAVKHTPRGTRVRVSAAREGGQVAVEVSDDGPGISPEERPYVLDQFFRGGPSTRRVSSGLGLGLTVADRILVQHGSRLEVIDDEGGARFRFRLPAADGGSS